MSEPTNAEEWLKLAIIERKAAAYMLDQANLRQAVFAHIGFGIEFTLKAAIQKKFRYFDIMNGRTGCERPITKSF